MHAVRVSLYREPTRSPVRRAVRRAALHGLFCYMAVRRASACAGCSLAWLALMLAGSGLTPLCCAGGARVRFWKLYNIWPCQSLSSLVPVSKAGATTLPRRTARPRRKTAARPRQRKAARSRVTKSPDSIRVVNHSRLARRGGRGRHHRAPARDSLLFSRLPPSKAHVQAEHHRRHPTATRRHTAPRQQRGGAPHSPVAHPWSSARGDKHGLAHEGNARIHDRALIVLRVV